MHLKPAGYSAQSGGLHILNKSLGAKQFSFHHAERHAERPKRSTELINSTFDRAKALERLVDELVLESNLAEHQQGGQVNEELALDKARQADEALESLRLLLLQEQRSTSSSSSSPSSPSSPTNNDRDDDDDATNNNNFKENRPMTTNLNYLDLFVMVKSNLAHQLHNNGHLQDSLELYTHLCKMATNAGPSAAVAQLAGSQQMKHQQQTNRYMLYRFGLNIGNVLYDMAEFQKALKYYRLTLDRLSSSGNRNLRVKLMSNIAVTLATINLTTTAEASKKPALITGDTVTAYDLLLADNLASEPGKPQQQPPASDGVAPVGEIYNANQHRFALNLMVCHYLRSDFRAMLLLLKKLVRLSFCHQYSRVIDADHLESLAKVVGASGELKATQSRLDSSGSSTLTDSGWAPSGARSPNVDELAGSTGRRPGDVQSRPSTTGSFSGFDDDAYSAASSSASSIKTVKANTKQVPGGAQTLLAAIKTDHLEETIAARETEISRCLLMACKLMNELDGNAIQGHCLRVLAASESHRHLVGELKFDCLASQLASPTGLENNLAGPVKLFEEIEAAGLAKQAEQQQVGPSRRQVQSAARTRRQQASSPFEEAGQPSSAVRQSVLLILRGQVERAKQLLEEMPSSSSSGGCKTRAEDKTGRLVNLAYCHDRLGDTKEALRCLEEALSGVVVGDPSSWLVSYNLLQASRKLGQHFDELPKTTGNFGLSRPQLLRLLGRRLLLQPVQLGLLLHQSGMSQACWSLFGDLLGSSGGSSEPPELHLTLSRLLGGSEVDAATSSLHKLDPLQLLVRANASHAYHVPVAERLVALQIGAFNYTEAERLLADCIKNQAGQVRWLQMLAECYRREANYKRAMEVYRLAVDLFPLEAVGCLRSLCKLARELGLLEEARQYELRLDKLTTSLV